MRRRPTALKALISIGAAFGLGIATQAAAINITNGDVVVRRLGSYGFTANNSFLSLDGGGGTDQLYQMFGYVGNADGVVAVNGGSFDVLSAISAVGNVANSVLELDNAGAAALGLTAGDIQVDYTFTLNDDTSPADRDGFDWDIRLTNASASDMTLSFYTYLDLDLDGAGDFADDVADATTSRIVVTDSSPGSTTEYVWRASNGGFADHFEVQAFPQVQNTLNGMTSATDLSDSQASFGPGDFSAAFQYYLFIPAGGSVDLGGGGVAAVPEPNTALLVGLGLAGLSMARRRNAARIASHA